MIRKVAIERVRELSESSLVFSLNDKKIEAVYKGITSAKLGDYSAGKIAKVWPADEFGLIAYDIQYDDGDNEKRTLAEYIRRRH